MWSSLRAITFDDGWKQRLDHSTDQTLESIMRSIFGSCGVPPAADDLQSQHNEPPSPPPPPASPVVSSHGSQPPQPQNDSLNKDERVRAAEAAVLSLRESHDPQRSLPRVPTPPDQQRLSRPFPVSSPPRPVPLPEVSGVHHDEEQKEAFFLADDISAISAQTLEEMARQNDGYDLHHGRSEESSLFESVVEDAVELARRRTNQTTRSLNTKSTRSTMSTEFEHAFRRDEQEYWLTVVEHDEQVKGECKSKTSRSRTREECRKLDLNRTFTTASSSMNTPFSRHPHDNILMFEPADCIPKLAIRQDPDRIQEALELDPCVEVAEI